MNVGLQQIGLSRNAPLRGSRSWTTRLTQRNQPQLFNYNAGSQEDVFLDDLYKATSSGVTKGVTLPTRYGNPVLDVLGVDGTWDRRKNYNTVLKIGELFKVWYASYETPVSQYYAAYATSSDGINWTKPNLNIITFDGNKNNNLIKQYITEPSVVYDADGAADAKYVMLAAESGKPAYTHTLYKSADGITWSNAIKDITREAYWEPRQLVKLPNGKWRIYYCEGNSTQRRKVGYCESDTTDWTGDWADIGVAIDTDDANYQKYAIGVQYVDGLYYGIISIYSLGTGLIYMSLYTSRDGVTWALNVDNWLPNTIGQWDSKMLTPGASLIKVGSLWRYYYSGFPVGHEDVQTESRIGFATVPYKRIGYIEGNGTFVTTAFTPNAPLYINAYLETGSMKVELLDASDDSVLTGYSKDDMDALPKDCTDKEVTWGGNSIPTDTEIKIKYYLISTTPTGLTANALGDTEIQLSWTNVGTGRTSIVRSDDGVTYREIAKVATGLTTYSDTTVVNGNYYYYKVASIDEGNVYSAYTAAVYKRAFLDPYILDTYSENIAQAISLRRLARAYTGSLIRVKRSSDNTEQDIGYISNSNPALNTTALLAFTGTGGTNQGYVVKWYDQSGNSRDVAEATNPPQIVVNGAVQTSDTYPSINFGVAKGLQSAAFSVAQPATKFFVFEFSQTNGNQVPSGSSNSSARHQITNLVASGGSMSLYAGVSLNGATTGVNNGHIHKLYAKFNGGTSRVAVDGVTGTAGDAGTQSNADVKLGYSTNSLPIGRYLEHIYFSANMDAARAAIEADIDAYYGL